MLTGKGDGPVLTSVTAAYLQRNLRPQVRSITVHPPGIVFQKPFTTGDPELAGFDDQTTPDRKLAAAASAQPGVVVGARPAHLSEGAADARLEGRRRERRRAASTTCCTGAKARRRGRRCARRRRTPILVWDTTTVPNGTYFVKIVASDAPSNPPGIALTGELDSVGVRHRQHAAGDRRRQRARRRAAGRSIAFDVKDDHSPIQRVEFSQDGQRWRGVFPVDGIADSRDEHYELAVDGELGDRGLTLRATDSMNNVATAHVDAPRRRR